MKLLLKCSLVAIILGITSFVIIQVPSVQDRIMSLVVSGMFNASDNLPKEDALMFFAHIGLIFATYITFKFFHKARKEQKSVFVEGNYNPAKIFSVLFIFFFIFIFTKGISVLQRTNSYTIQYDGPEKSTLQRIKDFVK